MDTEGILRLILIGSQNRLQYLKYKLNSCEKENLQNKKTRPVLNKETKEKLESLGYVQ
jgi:hypothetical protein